jgi:hypothetical protein
MRSSHANPFGRYATPADGRDVITAEPAVVVAGDLAVHARDESYASRVHL